MNKVLRSILETIGAIESQEAKLQQRLRQLSRTLPQGEATLVVRSVGNRENSAVAAIRDATGISLQEALAFLEILPAPLLINVSSVAAASAQKTLHVMGVETEIIGVYDPDAARREIEAKAPPAADLAEIAGIADMKPIDTEKAFASAAHFPPSTMTATHVEKGSYIVILERVGLLEERVQEGVQTLTGWEDARIEDLFEILPQPVLENVNQETAVRAQTQLQMVGAVVDIYDSRTTRRGEGAFDAPALSSYGLRLISAGDNRDMVVHGLQDMVELSETDAQALIRSLPQTIMTHADEELLRLVQMELEGLGATCELVKEEQPETRQRS